MENIKKKKSIMCSLPSIRRVPSYLRGFFVVQVGVRSFIRPTTTAGQDGAGGRKENKYNKRTKGGLRVVSDWVRCAIRLRILLQVSTPLFCLFCAALYLRLLQLGSISAQKGCSRRRVVGLWAGRALSYGGVSVFSQTKKKKGRVG